MAQLSSCVAGPNHQVVTSRPEGFGEEEIPRANMATSKMSVSCLEPNLYNYSINSDFFNVPI
jgi:hypothetical protein